MPGDFIINPEYGVVFSFGWGTLTYEHIVDHRRRLREDPRFRPEFNQIIDFSHVTKMALSNDDIALLARQPVFDRDSLRALVGATSLHYGLSRTFEAYSQSQNVTVFRNLNEAVEWVGTPMEVAEKAFQEFRSAHGLPAPGE
ncbi:MAG: hypothetical protein ACJ8KU_01560 [Chthoniobacterales bacterium]